MQDIAVKSEEIGPLTTGLVNVTAFSLIDQSSSEWVGMVMDWNSVMRDQPNANITLMKYVCLPSRVYSYQTRNYIRIQVSLFR